jgi:hypothetical protein
VQAIVERWLFSANNFLQLITVVVPDNGHRHATSCSSAVQATLTRKGVLLALKEKVVQILDAADVCDGDRVVVDQLAGQVVACGVDSA